VPSLPRLMCCSFEARPVLKLYNDARLRLANDPLAVLKPELR
jgi:hypothetical protein